MNTTRNQSNETSLDDVTLDQLNDERVKDTYVTLIIIGFLILPGIVGNLHILHIYFYKKQKNSTRVFLFFVAATDLVTCVICFPALIVNFTMPFKIVEKFDPFCRVLTFLREYVFACKELSMLVIVIDRYRRVCHPFRRQMNIIGAKMMCGLILFLAFVCETPLLALYGSTAKATGHPNITIYECDVLTYYRDSWVERVCTLFDSLCFVGVFISVFVFFLLFWIRIWQHLARINKMKIHCSSAFNMDKGEDVNNETQGQETEMVENNAASTAKPNEADESVESVAIQMMSQDDHKDVDDDGEDDDCSVYADDDTALMRTFNKDYKGKGESSKTPLKKSEIKRFKEMVKAIRMLSVVVTLYLLSLALYPLLPVAEKIEPFNSWSYTAKVLLLNTHSFVYINFVSNALIYTIFDSMFRQELKSFYGKLFCRR